MADKKLPRHKRMYKDSPKLERGEDGNMKAKKPSESRQEADKVQAGIDERQDVEPEEDARMQEIKDMHSRHQTEMAAVHKRHQKEDAKKYGKEEAAADDNESEGAGKKEIKEVEENKKITE